MTFEAFLCPNCKRRITTIDSSTRKAFCPFCDSLKVDVQERQAQLRADDTSSVTTTPIDFQIVGGVLKGYTGSATEIEIPDSVRVIGEKAFSSLAIERVDIPDGVLEIGKEAFSGCKWLTEIKLPNSLQSIGLAAFKGSSLMALDLPSGLSEIGMLAFDGTCLESVDVPDGVVSMGANCFSNCRELRSVSLPGSIKEIPDAAFYGCVNLSKICMPSFLSRIGEQAFAECFSLKSIVIPHSVTTIEEGAFAGCELTSLQLEKPVVNCRDRSFGRIQSQLMESQNRCPKCGEPYKGLFRKKCLKCGHLK